MRNIIETSWTSCERGVSALCGPECGARPPRLLTSSGGNIRVLAVWFRKAYFGAVPVGDKGMMRMNEIQLQPLTAVDAFFVLRSMSSVSRELTWNTMATPGSGDASIVLSRDEEVMVEMDVETPWMHAELMQ